MNLAYQCFKLALTANNDHAESYNNLGVLEMRLFTFFQHRESSERTLNESIVIFSYQIPMTNQTFTALQFPIITYLVNPVQSNSKYESGNDPFFTIFLKFCINH